MQGRIAGASLRVCFFLRSFLLNVLTRLDYWYFWFIFVSGFLGFFGGFFAGSCEKVNQSL